MPAFAGVDYDAGMNAYNKGDYKFAQVLFQKALQVNYYDVNARYMLCQILVRNKQYDSAKIQYQTILKIAPASQAATFAKQGIANIDAYKQKLAQEAQAANSQTAANSGNSTANNKANKTNSTVAKSTEPDYLKNAYRGGKKYLRPLGMTRVYIQSDSTFKPLMQQAYREWQSALGSQVMFTFSGNPDDANDRVSFSKIAGTTGMQQGGNCQYNIQGNTLQGATISIKSYDGNGKPLPAAFVYHTMLHEIGHSIGIMGHSTDPDDIMAQGATKAIAHLSSRDRNTARLLYKDYGSQPDIASIRKAKTAELVDIATRIPNDPSSLIDLGDEAMSAGQFDKAVDFYKKAEYIKPSVDICFRQIKAYKALNDPDNQASCYKKILNMDKANKVALNNLLVIYQNQERYLDGKNQLNTFIAQNPELSDDPDIAQLKNVFSDQRVQMLELRKKRFMKN